MRVKKLIRITMFTVLSLKRIETFIKSQISMNDYYKNGAVYNSSHFLLSQLWYSKKITNFIQIIPHGE